MIRPTTALLLALLAGPVLAQGADPTGDPNRFDPLLGDRSYSVYRSGRKTGWFRIALAAGAEWDGKKAFALTHEVVNFEAEGESTSKEVKYFDASPPHLLFGFEVDRVAPSGKTRESGRRTPTAMVVVRELMLKTEEAHGQSSEETLDHYLFAQVTCRSGRVRTVLRQPIKEYSTASRSDRDLEVVITPCPGLYDRGVAHWLYQVQAVDIANPNQPPFMLFLNDLGEIVEARSSDGVYMRPEPDAWARSRESKFFAVSHTYAAVEGKLPPASSPRALLVQVTGAEGAAPESTPWQGSFELEAKNWILTPKTLEWSENPGLATAPPGPEALATEPEVPVGDPAIVGKANELAAGAQSLEKKVARLLDWIVHETKPVRMAAISGATTFRMKAGDGPGRTALFAAMARSVGIPTRRVYGLVYRQSMVSYSEWAEVHDGKAWRPVDPGEGRTSLDGGHLRLGLVDADGSSRASTAMRGAAFRLLPMSDAFGHVIQFRDGRCVLGKQLFVEDNRMYARVANGEVWWPMDLVASADTATQEKVAASQRIVHDGLYRHNGFGLSLQLPAGWKAVVEADWRSDVGIQLGLHGPDDVGFVSMVAQPPRSPIETD